MFKKGYVLPSSKLRYHLGHKSWHRLYFWACLQSIVSQVNILTPVTCEKSRSSLEFHGRPSLNLWSLPKAWNWYETRISVCSDDYLCIATLQYVGVDWCFCHLYFCISIWLIVHAVQLSNDFILIFADSFSNFFTGIDMTATQLDMILHNSVESSIIHSLLLKHFETFYYDLMRSKDYTRVMEEPRSDNYTSKDVMRNIRFWIQNGTIWAQLYTWSIIPYNAHRVRQHQEDFKPFYSNTFIFFIF